MTPSAELHRPTVFVIEDDQALRRSLEFVLDLEGFVVVSFADGRTVRHHGGLAECDCLVVDLKLPDCDGLSLIHDMRSARAIPAILITTYPKPSERGRAQAMDVVLIEKPLLGSHFLDEVRRLVGVH